MTTVAWDGKTLAADTRATNNDMIIQGGCTKLFRVKRHKQEYLVGGAGDRHRVAQLVGVLGQKSGLTDLAELMPSETNHGFLIIHDCTTSKTYSYESSDSSLIERTEQYAIGSGASFAMGAMLAGCTAEGAVLIASKLDIHTNNIVDVMYEDDN